MKKILLTTMLLSTTIFAKINIATTYSYLGEVTKAIGANEVKVTVLANPKLDPHFITPKPSLLAKLRQEDLLIINGAQLEIGWLPPLLKSANNPNIRVGAKGFLDVSGAIDLIDKPKNVSRAYGDIHPDGNPHFATDIHNIIPIAKLIEMKLSQIDPSNSQTYEKNLNSFTKHIQDLIDKLALKECKTKKVIEYHKLFDYALKAYNINSLGTIEPLPGISPNSKHTIKLIQLIKQEGIKKILQDIYHEKKTANFIAKHSGAKVVILPHDVGSVKGSETLESFYTMIEQRLCQ